MMTRVSDSGALMQRLVNTITQGRVGLVLIIVTMLIATVTPSFFDWLWPTVTPKIHPCIKPISHMFDLNVTLEAWESYMTTEKVMLDGMTKRSIRGFLSFLHQSYSPCAKDLFDRVWEKPSDWWTKIKRLVGSEIFLLSLPGNLSLLILIIQFLRNKCCRGTDYKLLRKKNGTKPYLMK